ncbi:unnamed protein product [Ceutorhynchus assimilis]|uniref:Tesmin/TSO1-like CXC domain-containing protein n=1 Tax=Ceutorhynchus assimilis TaxID=467358 RepID=A0A9N9QGW9_9CUCU|nr:unnamed protein product [Ceutorhynchus assimilis]
MASAIMLEQCFICEESLAEREAVVVKKRGINKLLAPSLKRKKPDHQRLLEGVEKIEIHTSCQKIYNNDKLILASLRRDTPTTVHKLTRSGVIPITTTMDAAPDPILKIIRCKCTTGSSTGACSCKKTGLRCSAICKNCVGTACENSPKTDFNEDTDAECEEQANLFDEAIARKEKDNGDTEEDVPSGPKRLRSTDA